MKHNISLPAKNNSSWMSDKKKNHKEKIDEQLDELIENTNVQTSTLKKLLTELEKINTFKASKKSNKKHN